MSDIYGPCEWQGFSVVLATRRHDLCKRDVPKGMATMYIGHGDGLSPTIPR